MYLFGRTRSVAPGHVRAAMATAVEATERARQAMGHQVYSWTTLLSPGVGTMLFSARVQSLDELRVMTEKWVADEPVDGLARAAQPPLHRTVERPPDGDRPRRTDG